jgi:GTP cyclohydrolase III
MKKKIYTVTITLDSQVADSPLDAVKKAYELLMRNGNTFIYDAQDEETGEKFIVDLSEETVLFDND